MSLYTRISGIQMNFITLSHVNKKEQDARAITSPQPEIATLICGLLFFYVWGIIPLLVFV